MRLRLRHLAQIGAVLTFGCIAALYLWNIEGAGARLVLSFLAVFGIALLAAALARTGVE